MNNWNETNAYLVLKRDVKIDTPTVIVYESGLTRDWFVDPERPEIGYPFANVEKYPDAFIWSYSRAGLLQAVSRRAHALKHGDGTEGDVVCPRCGYKYHFNYYDHNDGAYTSAIIQDFKETVSCICGCKFTAKIRVQVSWDIEEKG
jgi:hypothetical protein